MLNASPEANRSVTFDDRGARQAKTARKTGAQKKAALKFSSRADR